jgi:hypothetical protein
MLLCALHAHNAFSFNRYQEHVMRDEESDAIRTLVPLYQAFSGRYGAVMNAVMVLS